MASSRFQDVSRSMQLRDEQHYSSDSESGDDLNDTLDLNDPLVLAAVRNDGDLPDNWEDPCPAGMPVTSSNNETDSLESDRDGYMNGTESWLPHEEEHKSWLSFQSIFEPWNPKDVPSSEKSGSSRKVLKPTRSYLDKSADDLRNSSNPPKKSLRRVREDVEKLQLEKANPHCTTYSNPSADNMTGAKEDASVLRTMEGGSTRKRSRKIVLSDDHLPSDGPKQKRSRPTVKKTVYWSPIDGFTTLYERCETEEDTDSE